jgi:signal peptidase I
MTYALDETTADDGTGEGEPPARRGLGCAFEIIETLVLTLVIYLLIHNFVAQPFEVRQNSMVPTIDPFDYVLIEKLTPRFGAYQRGDVVVFQPPDGFQQDGIPFIKRVIGLPGDTVRLENGAVLITPPSGPTVRIDEGYVVKTADGRTAPTVPRDQQRTEEWKVPEGEYFVMGDNRTVSEDSRIFGPIASDSIIGRAWLRYFPLDRIGFIERPQYADLSAQPVPSASSAVTLERSPMADVAAAERTGAVAASGP